MGEADSGAVETRGNVGVRALGGSGARQNMMKGRARGWGAQPHTCRDLQVTSWDHTF